MDIGEPHVPAAIEVSQERVIDSHQVQDRRMQIVNVDFVIGRRM